MELMKYSARRIAERVEAEFLTKPFAKGEDFGQWLLHKVLSDPVRMNELYRKNREQVPPVLTTARYYQKDFGIPDAGRLFAENTRGKDAPKLGKLFGFLFYHELQYNACREKDVDFLGITQAAQFYCQGQDGEEMYPEIVFE